MKVDHKRVDQELDFLLEGIFRIYPKLPKYLPFRIQIFDSFNVHKSPERMLDRAI
jgi:hypothetical protein